MGNGDYVRIAEQFRRLAKGNLPLENITDVVDFNNDFGTLEFDLDGRHIAWIAFLEGDWVNDRIIGNFAKLLTDRNTGRRFTYLDLGGQDCILGCSAPDQFKKLCNLTGLKWQWLT